MPLPFVSIDLMQLLAPPDSLYALEEGYRSEWPQVDAVGGCDIGQEGNVKKESSKVELSGDELSVSIVLVHQNQAVLYGRLGLNGDTKQRPKLEGKDTTTKKKR